MLYVYVFICKVLGLTVAAIAGTLTILSLGEFLLRWVTDYRYNYRVTSKLSRITGWFAKKIMKISWEMYVWEHPLTAIVMLMVAALVILVWPVVVPALLFVAAAFGARSLVRMGYSIKTLKNTIDSIKKED